MDKLDKRINSIYDVIDPNLDHLFIKNKLVISGRTSKEIKEQLTNFDVINKDINCFLIRIKINKKQKNILTINCTQQTIKRNLKLITGDDDMFQVFTYTAEELIKYGFKLSHLKGMMKAINNNLISFEKSNITFTELKKSLQK
jgi:hypothetical protein